MPPRERGAPDQIRPKHLGDYLEVMSKAVFQAGMSWDVVEAKWLTTREAFHDFDMNEIAKMGEPDVERLTKDTRVIRNRRKLEAILYNAGTLLTLEKEHGTFRKYLRSFDDYYALEKDLRKRFKFLGEMGIFYFLHVCREPVPDYHEWEAARQKK